MSRIQLPTGDVAGTLEALRADLSHIKYPHGLNAVRAEAGDPAELLPVLSFALLRFSRHVALLCQDYQLHGKTDQRFVEAAWRFARDGLGLPNPALTPAQFLSEGFAERKLLLLRQVIKACKDHHNAAARKERLAALKGATHSEQRLLCQAGSEPAGDAGSGSSRSPGKGRGRGRQPAPRVKVVSTLALPAPTPAPPAPRVGAGVDSCRLRGGADCAPAAREAARCTPPSGTGCSPAALPAQEGYAAGHCGEVAVQGDAHCRRFLQQQPPPPSPQAEQPRPLPAPLLAKGALQLGWHDTGQAGAAGPAAGLGPAPGQHATPFPPSAAGQSAHSQPAMWVPPGPHSTTSAVPSTNSWAAEIQMQQGMIPSRSYVPCQAAAVAGCSGGAAYPAAVPSTSGGAGAHAVTHLGVPAPAQLPVPQQGPTAGDCQQWAAWPHQPQVVQASQHSGYAHAPPAPQEQQQQQQQAYAVATGALPASAADSITRQLIDDLQLRLQLAEGTAREARHAAERVQDGLQARIAVLEGRVKFLESGFGLQPLGPAAPLLQLPWGSPPQTPSHAQQPAPAVPRGPAGRGIAAHHLTAHGAQQQHQFRQSLPGCALAQQGVPAAVCGSSGSRGLMGQQEQQRQSLVGLSGRCITAAAPSTLCLPHAATGVAKAPAPLASSSLPDLGATQRSVSSTAELISSMHSRFSEADELLRSFQRH